MSTQTKKWFVLLALLAVTVWLAWQAPTTETPVVSAVKPVKQLDVVEANQSNYSQGLMLAEREKANTVVDIFNTPVRIVAKPKVVKTPVNTPSKPRIRLPYQYQGKLVEAETTRFFVMENQRLYLVEVGDLINDQFRLVEHDQKTDTLVWRHLASNDIFKMSIKR